MRIWISITLLLCMTLLSALSGGPAAAQSGTTPGDTLPSTSETLSPLKDNTLFEDEMGELSNGAGPYLYAGATQNAGVRRAVLAFDLSGLPQGATITSATLRLHVSKIPPGQSAYDMTLHRLTTSWGEGASIASGPGGQGEPAQPDDATWLYRFFGDDADSALQWATPGGDFVDTASATANVGGVGDVAWSSAQMAADVQAWLADPSTNHGWLLLGAENETQTAKRFDSRENANEEMRPVLIVEYASSGSQLFLPIVNRVE